MKGLKTNFLFLFITLISCSCSASKLDKPEDPERVFEEQVNVFVDKIVGPVTYAGSGWLSGAFSNEQPTDKLLLPLKTQRVRGREEYITSVYEKCKRIGITMELVTNKNSDFKSLALDGTDDMTSYIERHTALVNRMLQRGMGDVSYSIFQESNARGLGWNESNEPHYLEAYRLAYNAIKQADPTALVVGPNAQWGPWTWWWSEHKGDYTWFIRNFIDYCTDNQCIPDIIAWHDGYNCDGFGIANAAEEIRNHIKKKGIAPIPLEQDDVGCKDGQFRPGTYVSYLANMERAKITYSCKCCWDGDCHINTLQGMLTKDNREPRSLWWMYKSYGDLAGQIVEVDPSNTVDGVVAIDSGSDIIRAVIGRFQDSSKPVLIRLQGLDSRFKSAGVVAERIENTEDKPLRNPKKTIEKSFKIKNGQIEVILNDLGAFDAYTLTLHLSEK
jgi:hypothetical protein